MNLKKFSWSSLTLCWTSSTSFAARSASSTDLFRSSRKLSPEISPSSNRLPLSPVRLPDTAVVNFDVQQIMVWYSATIIISMNAWIIMCYCMYECYYYVMHVCKVKLPELDDTLLDSLYPLASYLSPLCSSLSSKTVYMYNKCIVRNRRNMNVRSRVIIPKALWPFQFLYFFCVHYWNAKSGAWKKANTNLLRYPVP